MSRWLAPSAEAKPGSDERGSDGSSPAKRGSVTAEGGGGCGAAPHLCLPPHHAAIVPLPRRSRQGRNRRRPGTPRMAAPLRLLASPPAGGAVSRAFLRPRHRWRSSLRDRLKLPDLHPRPARGDRPAGKLLRPLRIADGPGADKTLQRSPLFVGSDRLRGPALPDPTAASTFARSAPVIQLLRQRPARLRLLDHTMSLARLLALPLPLSAG